MPIDFERIASELSRRTSMDENREVGLSGAEASTANKPSGTYRLQLVGVDDPEDNKFGGAPRCKFRFEVVEFEPEDWPDASDFGDDDLGFQEAEAWASREADKMVGKELHFRYTMSLGERTDLFPVYRALARRDLEKNERPRPWSLIGREIIATIQPKVPPSGGDPTPKIVAAKPYRRPQTKTAAAAGVNLVSNESVDDVPF